LFLKGKLKVSFFLFRLRRLPCEIRLSNATRHDAQIQVGIPDGPDEGEEVVLVEFKSRPHVKLAEMCLDQLQSGVDDEAATALKVHLAGDDGRRWGQFWLGNGFDGG
jgi:hypothetical protein